MADDTTACPHCPDGHAHPTTRPWGVYVHPARDSDGQPTHLVVQPSNGAHVAESDAAWVRGLLNAAPVSDTGAVERAAAYASGEWCGECRYGIAEDPPCCTPCPCCGGHSGEHAPRITLAAAAPTVEQVAEVLAAHPRLRSTAFDDPWLVCSGCGAEIETDAHAAREEFAAHQAEQVAALWGAR